MDANSARALIASLRERARHRYPGLPESERARLVRGAAAAVAGRALEHEDERVVAAHVALARGGGLAEQRAGTPLAVEAHVASAAPAERALAEHLHAQLEPEEQLVIALLATCQIPHRRAAAALNLTTAELRGLEERARAEAERQVVPHHHELICEPAELAGAASPLAVAEAVRGHLGHCRACRREFAERVSLVLAHAGALAMPLPPLTVPARRFRPRVSRVPRR